MYRIHINYDPRKGKQMKKIVVTLLLVVSCGLLWACGSTKEKQEKTEAAVAQTSARTEESTEGGTSKEAEESAQGKASKEAERTEANKPIYIGQTSIVKALNPTDSSVPWQLTSHGVSETVYMQDEQGNLYSRFIDTLSQTGDNDWKAVMKQGVKFSDGSDVDAKALCDSMNEIMDKNQLSNATAGKMVFTPADEMSFTIKTTRPTKQLQSVFTEWTNIVFKELGNGEYAFTGPYMVNKLDTGVQLELTPNPYYDQDASRRSPVVVKVFQDAGAMKLAFESGEIDIAFTVTPDVADMLEAEGKTVKNIDAGYQYFAILNLKTPALGELAVRQALNLAINREDMVKALKGGHVAKGIFAGYYSFAGDSSITYDMEGAKKTLDEAGWKPASGGIRKKDGKSLSLKLVTYPSRPDLSILMQLAAAQLKELGVEVKTEIVDNIDNVGHQGDYDIIFYAQHTAPTGDPAFFLNQFFRGGEVKNFNDYSSGELNSVLDKMGSLPYGADKDKLAVQAQAILYKDLPVLYLVDPQWHVAVSERLKNYVPYCGDYYVINARLGLD